MFLMHANELCWDCVITAEQSCVILHGGFQFAFRNAEVGWDWSLDVSVLIAG